MDYYEEGYKELGCAIVLQALKDYAGAFRRLKENEKDEKAIKEIASCEEFFRSGWFEALSDANGEELIRSIRKRIESGEMYIAS